MTTEHSISAGAVAALAKTLSNEDFSLLLAIAASEIDPPPVYYGSIKSDAVKVFIDDHDGRAALNFKGVILVSLILKSLETLVEEIRS